jgi:chromate transporter
MRQLCLRRGWLTEKAFVDILILSRLTPGISILAQALLIGRAVCGIPGMIAALLGLLTPSIAITLLLAWIYERISDLPSTREPLHAIAAVAAGFAVALSIQLSQAVIGDKRFRRNALLFVLYVVLGLVIPDPLLVMGIAVGAAMILPSLFDIAPVDPARQLDSESER